MEIDERMIRLLREFYEGLLEIGVDAEYLGVTPERPLPSILVQAPPDGEGEQRVILLAFIPDDGLLAEVDLLQLYMPLPVSQEEAAASRLLLVNANAVLGHAGIMESGEVYWRHVWPLPQGMPVITAVLFEVIQFFVFSAELGMATLRKST
jgi:hypothetical protein